MSKKQIARKPLKEKGLGFFNIKLNDDKVIYNFHIGTGSNESFSEKNVLNFVARSYKESCLRLLEQMKHYKKDNEKLALLYLPAMFCFRHYLELKLKLLYLDWHNEEFWNTHDLNDLLDDLEKNSTCDMGTFRAPIDYITHLEQINNKQTVEFFRYLIDPQFNCKESIEIPMYEFDKIFNFIANIERETTIAKINSLSNNQ